MENLKTNFSSSLEVISTLVLDLVAVQLLQTEMLKEIGKKLGIEFKDLSGEVVAQRNHLLKVLHETYSKSPPDIEESFGPE